MIGGQTGVYQDAAPYTLCTGPRAKVYGINKIGLERNGFQPEEISMVQSFFDIYFSSGLVSRQALEKIRQEIPKNIIRERFIDFITGSKRGIITKT